MNSTRESEVQSTQQVRWEKLVSALAEDVWVADAQGLTAEVIAGGDSHVLPAASMPIMERMEAIHPDDREQVLGEVMKTIMLGQPMKVEARVQTKYGYEYREILATPVRDEAGTVIEWVGCNRDIHDRRVAEMKLRRDNLFLELLSEAVQQLLRSQDPARTMQELFARFGERLELDAFAILEIDRDTGKLKLADMAAVPADVAQRLSTLTIHHPVIADCIEARSCQQLDGGCPEASEAFPELCHWGAKSCLLLPLVVDDRLHSLLWLVSKRKEAFDEEEVSVFETLSRNIAATLQRVAMEARIQRSITQLVEEAQQRKLVEQQLLEREECLRIAINAAGMSAWVMDPVQKNIRVIARTDDWGDVNPSMELHWDQALERVHPDHYPHFELSSLLNDPRQPLLHEGRVKKHDGTWVDTISKGKLVEVPGNPVPQVFAVTMDITELKAIQEKLRQSEMHLRDAQSIANIGSFTWDLQTNQFMWSEELYRIFGKQADEFTPDLEQFLALVSSRERDEVRDTMLRAARECTAFQLEYSFVRQDGSVAYIVMQAKPVAGKHGKVVSFQGTCQDITVRKERERTLRETEMRFRQMADSIEDVFWLFDPIKNRTLYVSPRVVDVWGFTVDDAIDNPLLFLNSVHPEDREKVNQRLVRQGAGEACNDTFRIVKPDGSIRWLHDRTFPVLDAQGRVEQVAGITRDITDQILAEQRLSLQQTQLLHVSRLSTLGMMAATLSHELNQPLSAISNFAAASQALAQDPANFDRVRDNVGQIVRQSIRAGQIVRRVREFATKAAPSREKCEMNSVLEDSCEFVSSQFSHLGVRVEWELLDEPLALAGDPIQLQQLFVNLLTNAADALKDRQPQERIVTIRSRTDGEWVIGEVEDSGDGFTTESLERTFEPFYTTKQRGTGLGLSICQAIAHDHNGEITASHGVRGGARLTVRLPRA